ncbi:MAG: glutathione S-transferase [Proteobacteria bacterium]|nr:glutathione S-transferase [Pseudomonadota bacterium]
MIKLYQFPISHYCEKIRWALDYKNIEYESVNLIPGLHIKQTKKMGLRSSVPILQHGGKYIQGSINIIDYLDLTFPQSQLSSGSVVLKSEALEWEKYLDKEVGVHVRRCIYHILLDHPAIVKPFFLKDGPWYGPLYLFLAYPKLVKVMREFMNINPESAAQSRKALNLAVDKLDAHYKGNNFLAGEQFSRADLSAAALLAPLTMEKQYGLDWPQQLPDDLRELMDEFSPRLGWVSRIYSSYR